MRGSASEDDFSSGNPFLFCSQNWVCRFIAGTRGADSGGRLENEPRGFQMAASGAKMALGFRAQNPETKARSVSAKAPRARVSRRVKRQGWLSRSRMPPERRCQPKMRRHPFSPSAAVPAEPKRGFFELKMEHMPFLQLKAYVSEIPLLRPF